MSLKAIELQLALPKTQDIGNLQHQLHQRNNIEQSVLMTQMKQLEIEKRKKTEKTSKSTLREQNTLKKPKLDTLRDPNRGKFIDIEL